MVLQVVGQKAFVKTFLDTTTNLYGFEQERLSIQRQKWLMRVPDKDVTVRGAISIGRRLLDPLLEISKIDPKSIGVGQYQHDVDQRHY